VTEVRVALLAEDRNFVDFLVPAIESVAAERGRRVSWMMRAHLSGCRAARLKFEVARVSPNADLVIVGADAMGKGHALRGGGHRRKRADLCRFLDDSPSVCVVVADPCVEAWLYCNPRGFTRGLAQALETSFKTPSNWPVPTTEAEAKNQLGRLISEGLGAELARNGFEFAAEIVEAMLGETLASPSLRDCFSDLAKALVRIG
jgi:hypothetical protein